MPSQPSAPRFRLLLALVVMLAVLAVTPAHTGAGLAAQPATPSTAEPGPDPALVKAVEYLVGQQGADGGFAGPTGEPDPATTIEAVLALKAAGQQGVETAADLDLALTYLVEHGAAYAERGPGQAAKLAQAAVAGGHDPRTFAGLDLIAALTAPAPGSAVATPDGTGTLAGDSVFSHALVLLALAAANEPAPVAMIEPLRTTQIEDGSWSFAGTTDPGSGDSNTTALVIQALVATGHGDDPMIDAALAYVQRVQNEFGQVLYQAGLADMADANSTALTVQALIAAGQDPTSPEWRNAARGLAVFQNVSGGFRYVDAAPADNLMATVQAIPALAGYALPVATACADDAVPAAIDATPAIIELPAPGRGQAPCVPLAPAA